MTARIVGYEGEGRGRKAIWFTEGPAPDRDGGSPSIGLGGELVRGEPGPYAVARAKRMAWTRQHREAER